MQTKKKYTLKDPIYNFFVTVFIKFITITDVIEQWSLISHHEKSDVVLHKFASANLYLKGNTFWLKQYHGDWASELKPEEELLTHGIKILDSKLGTRANLFQPSFFMVSKEKPSTEDDGEVLLGSLEWSGNFRTDLEIDPLNNLRIISGINNYASDYKLKKNTDFTTPKFLYTFSSQGKGLAR